MSPQPMLPEPTETGALGVFQLKRIWATRAAKVPLSRPDEWPLDRIVLYGLNLALEETMTYLAEAKPTFPDFEAWVLQRNRRGLDPLRVARLNAAVAAVSGLAPSPSPDTHDVDGPCDEVLSTADHAHFAEHGFVVVREAVPRRQALAAGKALCGSAGLDPDDPGSWYQPRTHGIMQQTFHHPDQEAARANARVRGAFAEIYGSRDLWMSVDRFSFNPPEREGWRFPGPHLHWDADVTSRPMPFLTQGILYLSDTPAHQGAFACVPGFHRRIDQWLVDRGADSYPQGEELGDVTPTPIPGDAGDLVIWHQALPHAATPNTGTRPRIVQYVNMLPTPPCRIRSEAAAATRPAARAAIG